MEPQALNYNEFIEIAQGVYWVGFVEEGVGLHCNPYLIVDGGEAVLVDGGSRGDFSTVMLKIMRTGTNPSQIRRLIYHHYDPDLCSNLPHLEALIHSDELKIISHFENNIFINYYSAGSPKLCIEQMGYGYTMAGGRRLRFIRTPYAHSPGSFVTYDESTQTLFSSDLFGSYDNHWSLYTQIDADCETCQAPRVCPKTGRPCQMRGILNFHERIMTSKKALDYALDQIEKLDIALIAPQHGSVLHTPQARSAVIRQLRALPNVGIDHFLEGGGA